MATDRGELRLIIQSPDKEWHNDAATKVRLTTDLGELEVFPGHASLVGSIAFSVVEVTHGDHQDEYILRRGFVTIEGDEANTVRVMAQHCERKADMDMKSLEEYREFIVNLLKDPEKLNDYQVRFLESEQGALEKSIEVISMEKEEVK